MPTVMVSKNQVPSLADKGGDIRILISPKTTNSTHMIMGISNLPAGETVKLHRHDYSEECFYVISGKGLLYIDNDPPIEFFSGSALFIRKGSPHSIVNHGTENLQVVFASSPLAPKPEKGHQNLFEQGN